MLFKVPGESSSLSCYGEKVEVNGTARPSKVSFSSPDSFLRLFHVSKWPLPR